MVTDTPFLAAVLAAVYPTIAAAFHWVAAHQTEIVATAAALVAFTRAVPPERWQRLEQGFPRLANTARFARAMFPDVVKAARALAAIWLGRAWSSPPAPAEPRVSRNGAPS